MGTGVREGGTDVGEGSTAVVGLGNSLPALGAVAVGRSAAVLEEGALSITAGGGVLSLSAGVGDSTI